MWSTARLTGGHLPSPLDSASAIPSPAPIELWLLRIADVDTRRLDPSVLDDEERRRAQALIGADDRAAFLAAHLLLRQLLSRHLRCEPKAIAYSRERCPVCGGPNGRPVLDGASVPHFSLSRSGGLVLVGIASAPVGVDIEALPSDEVADDVVTLLHPAEREEVSAVEPSKRSAVFAQLWARKEAYLKGLGTGVAHGLADHYLGAGRRPRTPAGWTVVDVPVGPGYAAAAAVRATPRRRSGLRRGGDPRGQATER